MHCGVTRLVNAMLPKWSRTSPVMRPPRHAEWLGEAVTIIYIAAIGFVAQFTGFAYILFPELGALSHDILKRPHGTWARAPLMLVVTPLLTGTVGTLITRHLAYGLPSILVTVICAVAIIRILKSPIAPAISAGLLPLTLGVTSWWYPPSLLIGTVALAVISLLWRRIFPPPPSAGSPADRADDIVEEPPIGFSHVPFFFGFLLLAAAIAGATGWRFVLFPPLVVIGFEMFAHSAVCPWAGRPLVLPIACALTAAGGVLLVHLFGAGLLAAACSIGFGVATLRLFDLHVPPALAVGLLPFVIANPGYRFSIFVGVGTLLLTTCFLAWRAMNAWSCRSTTM